MSAVISFHLLLFLIPWRSNVIWPRPFDRSIVKFEIPMFRVISQSFLYKITLQKVNYLNWVLKCEKQKKRAKIYGSENWALDLFNLVCVAGCCNIWLKFHNNVYHFLISDIYKVDKLSFKKMLYVNFTEKKEVSFRPNVWFRRSCNKKEPLRRKRNPKRRIR